MPKSSDKQVKFSDTQRGKQDKFRIRRNTVFAKCRTLAGECNAKILMIVERDGKVEVFNSSDESRAAGGIDIKYLLQESYPPAVLWTANRVGEKIAGVREAGAQRRKLRDIAPKTASDERSSTKRGKQTRVATRGLTDSAIPLSINAIGISIRNMPPPPLLMISPVLERGDQQVSRNYSF